jgi:hypothetical protein
MRTIEVATDIEASPQLVWEVLTDFPRYPEWTKSTTWIREIDGRAEAGTNFRILARPPDRQPYDLRPRFLEATPGVRLAWRPELPGATWLPSAIFGGAHEFVLTALPHGATRLLHSEHFSGVLARLTRQGPRGADEGFEAFNTALKHRVESLRDGVEKPTGGSDEAGRPA